MYRVSKYKVPFWARAACSSLLLGLPGKEEKKKKKEEERTILNFLAATLLLLGNSFAVA